MKHHGFKHSHIEWHDDGSGTVEHHHKDGPHKNVKHAALNLDHVHDSLQDHIGTANPGEAQASAGDHGVPMAQAAPAGLPVAPSQPAGV